MISGYSLVSRRVFVTPEGETIHETVEEAVETEGGRESPVKITRQKGVQTVEFNGEPVKVSRLTIYETSKGTSRSMTRVPEAEPTPEERERVRRRIQEAAVRCMTDQGLW